MAKQTDKVPFELVPSTVASPAPCATPASSLWAPASLLREGIAHRPEKALPFFLPLANSQLQVSLQPSVLPSVLQGALRTAQVALAVSHHAPV